MFDLTAVRQTGGNYGLEVDSVEEGKTKIFCDKRILSYLLLPWHSLFGAYDDSVVTFEELCALPLKLFFSLKDPNNLFGSEGFHSHTQSFPTPDP